MVPPPAPPRAAPRPRRRAVHRAPRVPAAVLAALAALAGLAGPGVAEHMGMYATNPVEHDDQGRSDEPDFAQTSVLGPRLENRVVDLDGDGAAVPDSQLPPAPGMAPVLAPGCWSPLGRAPSGACGVCTVGLGLPHPDPVPPVQVLEPGQVCPVPRGPSPGAYTPTPQTRIRFLDVRADAMALVVHVPVRVDLNHKVADAARLAPMDGVLPVEPALAGPTGLWAWLGDWQDKNGNGVIDHLGDERGGLAAANEFVWVGGCITFLGAYRPGPHCTPEPGAHLVGYAFPGDHGGRSGLCSSGVACVEALPGHAIACHFVALVPPEALSCYEAHDPLLGPQEARGPDGAFHDRTGDPALSTRGWFYGIGFPTWYYDQSLVVGHVMVSAYRAPPAPGSVLGFLLEEAPFLDVDLHRAVHPLLEPLVQHAVKPAARAQWETLRESLPPTQAAPPLPAPLPPLPAVPGWPAPGA